MDKRVITDVIGLVRFIGDAALEGFLFVQPGRGDYATVWPNSPITRTPHLKMFGDILFLVSANRAEVVRGTDARRGVRVYWR